LIGKLERNKGRKNGIYLHGLSHNAGHSRRHEREDQDTKQKHDQKKRKRRKNEEEPNKERKIEEKHIYGIADNNLEYQLEGNYYFSSGQTKTKHEQSEFCHNSLWLS
jgi:hypothetical protein